MKVVLVLAFLIAGISASALPEAALDFTAERQQRIVTDAIVSVIEDLSQGIKDAGFDPLQIKKENFIYELPVPVIFNAGLLVEEVLSTGLSEIIVNSINFSIIFSRLTFNIELPHIHLSARKADGELTFFGRTINAEADGRVNIRNIVVIGEVRISIGIISGISISSIDIDLSVGSIDTNIRLAVQGNNYSEQINKLIGTTIPEVLDEFSEEINELIEIILLDVINDVL